MQVGRKEVTCRPSIWPRSGAFLGQVELSEQVLEALQTLMVRIDNGDGDFVGDGRHCFVGIGI
jgi:hypothetical protein